MKKVKDTYFHKAKKEGYAARAVYKLEEIDKKNQILKKGNRVLDLGCSPGSWLQYAARRVGDKGLVLGIDLQPVSIQLPSNVKVLQADIFQLPDIPEFEMPYDVILSDMAPKTTGIRSMDAQKSYNLCQQALFIAQKHLSPKGALLVKAFQGASFEQLRKDFQQTFLKVKICKPKSSRQESVEIFLLGQQVRPQDNEKEETSNY